MPISDKPWGSIDASDFEDAAAYCRACLIDMNEGSDKIKDNCKLPVYEPSGALNRNGCHAAAVALAGGRTPLKLPPEEKRTAARKLLRLYRELKDEPPESLRRLAGG